MPRSTAASPTGPGGVAAAAEHRVGPVAAQQARGGAERERRLGRRARRLQRVRARDALDAQRIELVAGGRHQLGLGALAAGEADVGALSPQRVGDRDRRNHVAGRSARRDHDPGGALTAAVHRAQVRRAAAGDVQQQAHRAQQDDQRRRARRDERQRHAGERRESEDGVDVEQRLAQDQAGEAAGEQLRVGALRVAGGPQPRVPDHAVQAQQRADSRQPELLADHREDEVRVRLGQVEDLLHRLPRPEPEQPAGADRDLALDGLEAGAGGVRPRVDERSSAASVRSGSISANTSTRNAPTPTTRPSWRSGSPAATSIAASVSPITSAVPRSGCLRISSIAAPPTPSTGPATPRRLRAIRGRALRTAAVCSTSASFITSDGWNVSGPAPSQRRAPLIRTPDVRDQHEHEHHERDRPGSAARACARRRGRGARAGA